MLHVVIDGPRQVRVVEAPDAVPPDARGAVVAVDAAAICGSDLHFYDGDIPVGGGFSVGHEFLGTVVEVGSEVRLFRPGDRVLTASVAGCGHCDGCATGDPVACVEGPKVFGSGALPEVRPRRWRYRRLISRCSGSRKGSTTRRPCCSPTTSTPGGSAPSGPTYRQGARWWYWALAPSGSARCAPRLALGAGRVLAADPVAGRRALAADSGAIPIEGPTVEAVLETTGGRGADAVIDAVALDATLTAALTCVRAGGTVSVIGVHNLEPYPLPILAGLFRSVTLRMTTAPVHQTWKELVPLVAHGRLRTDGIFTHRFPLVEASEAYAAAAARTADCIKVMMRP